MRDCSRPEMKDLLPELLSTDSGHEEVRAHVAGCASCARELSILRDARSASKTPDLDVERIAAGIAPYRPSAWRGATGSPWLRVAAVVVLAAGGATLLRMARPAPAPDTAVVRVATQETVRAVSESATSAAAMRAPAMSPELAVGDPLTDLSESDLRALLQEMRDLKAVTPTETDMVVLPAVTQGGE